MWFLKKNNLISQNYQCFTESTERGTENILWKFELDEIFFLDFTGIGSLKHKEIKVVQNFFDEYIYSLMSIRRDYRYLHFNLGQRDEFNLSTCSNITNLHAYGPREDAGV